MRCQLSDEFWSDNRQAVFLVLGGHQEKPDISRNDIDRLAEGGNSVLFQSGLQLQNAILAEPRWADVKSLAINHAERQNDDEAYGAAQETTLSIMAALAREIPEQLRTDFEAMAESIAMATADHFVLVDLLAEYVVQECRRRDHRTAVIMCGPRNVDTALGLKGALAEAGLACRVRVSGAEGKVTALLSRLQLLRDRLRGAPLGFTNDIAALRPQIPRAGNREAVDRNIRAFADQLAGCEVLLFFNDRDRNYGDNAAVLLRQASETVFCIASLTETTGPTLAERFDAQGHRTFDVLPVFRLGLPTKEHAALKSVVSRFFGPAATLAGISGLRDRDEIYLRSVADKLVRHLFSGLAWFRNFRKALAVSGLRSVVLSPSRNLPARALTAAALVEGIPTFDLPTGTLTYSRRQWRPIADFVFAADMVAQDIYRRFFGMPAARVLLVGAPRLDAAVHRVRAVDPVPRQDGGVFLALQHLKPEVNAKLISMTAQAVAQAGRSHLTVGFHPRENIVNRAFLLSLLNGLPVKAEVCEGDSLMSIARHEICVTYFSFIGLEAFALGVRCIAVNPTDGPWPVRLAEMGIAEEAETTQALAALLNGARTFEFSPDLEVLRDGRSAGRILGYLQAPPPTSCQALTAPRPKALTQSDAPALR